jgi:hypothetical protein
MVIAGWLGIGQTESAADTVDVDHLPVVKLGPVDGFVLVAAPNTGSLLRVERHPRRGDSIAAVGEFEKSSTKTVGVLTLSVNSTIDGRSPLGPPNYTSDALSKTPDIVPMPEPLALCGVVGLFGLIGFRERNRLQQWMSGFSIPA